MKFAPDILRPFEKLVCTFFYLALYEIAKAVVKHTNKETDVSWDISITRKINSGLVWAAGPVHEKKSLGLIMSNF